MKVERVQTVTASQFVGGQDVLVALLTRYRKSLN